MACNSFGSLLRMTTFGESHGVALGVIVDGCPANLSLSEEDMLPELARRRPGQSDVTSARRENDVPRILSGVFEGKTTGMPIAVVVENTNQRSEDYEALRHRHRPGHADATYTAKYGHRDHRGGGRSSGRETVARVIAGVIARKILPSSVRIIGHTIQIGSHAAKIFDAHFIEQNVMRCADPSAAKEMESYVTDLRKRGDSSGGLIEVRITNPPVSLGDPIFGKLKARFADAFLSIGAVTGYSYGAGFEVAKMRGLEYVAHTQNFGGMLGGISTGEDIVLQASVKPPSSVGEIAKKGRHDPCIVPRVIPVLEAMSAFVLADAFLLKKAYGNSDAQNLS